MKGNISEIIKKYHKEHISQNDRFWTEIVKELSSALRRSGIPVFLSNWVKESLNMLDKVKITLVMPKDGCWGVYVNNREDYLFYCNDGFENIYISKRMYDHLKNKGSSKLIAGILLHELTEIIMCQRARKRGKELDMGKIRGEVKRIDREFHGRDEKLNNELKNLVELELERKKVSIDNEDVFVEGCVVTGEEIVAEIRSVYPAPARGGVKDMKESFIAELAPGERKNLKYSGGSFTVKAKSFEMPFKLEGISFQDYCKLMSVMDNLFIEESITKGHFAELLLYIRNLNCFEEYDNLLLKLIWMFTDKFFRKNSREEFLYNLYLLADKYASYFSFLEDIRERYWRKGKYVRDCIKEIIREVYDRKEIVLETKKENNARMTEWILNWFSRMEGAPEWFSMEQVPEKLKKAPKVRAAKSDGLSVHKKILEAMRKILELKSELRIYRGVNRHAGSKVCEMSMVRTHFWCGDRLFKKSEKAGVHDSKKKWAGIIEILDVREDSIIVSLSSYDSTIPENGFVKKMEEPDEAIEAEIEAIINLERRKCIAGKILTAKTSKKEEKFTKIIEYFNPLINEDKSQKESVARALGKEMITLIQGPPGTGKTTVIAEIVLQHMKNGKRVLLSSQTHSAVDNALENIMRFKSQDIGVGRVASKKEKIVDNKIKNIWIEDKRELDYFESKYRQGLVIGATNVGTHTLTLMKEREFDVLVMDEAGKSNIVESILPMLLLKSDGKTVIVGDHMQGRPFEYDERVVNLLIKDEKTKEKLNQSFFEELVKKGYHSNMLRTNYRSEPQIVKLISNLFYKGMLVPKKSVSRKAKSIIVVDTSKLASIEKRKETSIGKGFKNSFEAGLVLDELKGILKHRYIATGIKSRYITGVTILVPYLHQVEEIRNVISKGLAGLLSRPAIENLISNTMTIDSFQGREDEIVIISFTRSNVNPSEVGFLNELNRINVALSRAKKKMILIGDFQTLQNTRSGPNARITREIFRTIYRFG